MFLLPFLKYLRPYVGRLVLAVACMVLVAMLTQAPILLGIEAVAIIEDGAPDESLDADNPGGLAGILLSAGQQARASSDAPPEAETAESPESLAEQWLGPIWTGPRDWGRARAARFMQWYGPIRIDAPMKAIGLVAVLIVLLTAVKGAAMFLSKYELSYTFYQSSLAIREDIFRNIIGQDYLYFNRHSAGYLHSRINSDVKAIQDIMERALGDGVQQPLNLIFTLGLLLLISAKLTLYVALILPAVGILLYVFARMLRKNTRRMKKRADKLSSTMTESLTNVRLVKALGTEQLEGAKFHERSMALFRYMMAQRVAKFGSSPIMETLGTLAVASVLLVGGGMIFRGELSFAMFTGYVMALSRFYRPLKSMAALVNKWQVARVSCERMSEMLDLRPELHDAPDARPFSRIERAIELRGLGFTYEREPVLSGISLEVPRGMSVALVGASGSGKTTLVNLVARLIDPTEGAILVDGVDLRGLRVRDWRDRLAIVTQETVLFNDTVVRNIAYGAETVDMARVETAARAAQAHDFITELDVGYETVVGPTGARLSGGQRQRLAIARALYRDPEVLILDEATSALDAHAQSLVQASLATLMQGRTTFIIAHRISTVRDADLICVLEGGRIAEQGSHEALMAHDGAYAALVRQAGHTDKLASRT